MVVLISPAGRRGATAAAGVAALLAAWTSQGLAAPRQEGGAPAASIRGRVELRRAGGPEPERPNVAGLGTSARRDAPGRSRSVVFLETAPLGAFERPAARHATLDQRDESFVPHVLPIAVGTTVEFPNSDSTYHNVFSLSKPKRFDLGRYPRGRSRSVRFEQAGVVRVFCEIHSHMNAWILVFAHRFFAATDAGGAYAIEDVPPGSYTLALWSDGEVRERRRVRVPAEGGVVEQDFVVE